MIVTTISIEQTLRDRGWSRNYLVDPDTGAVCILGAVCTIGQQFTDNSVFHQKLLVRALYETSPLYSEYSPHFNGLNNGFWYAYTAGVIENNTTITKEQVLEWAHRADIRYQEILEEIQNG